MAPPPPSALPSSCVLGVLSSPLFVPLGAATSGSGVPTSDAPREHFSSSGTSYANFVGPCAFLDGDDSSTKGEKESPALGKSESSKIFHEVVNLIIGFFPRAKLDPWLNVVNMAQQRGPRIFLTLFEKLATVSKEVLEKFCKAADDDKKTSLALRTWGDVYRLSNLPDFYKVPKLNESFSQLLEKTLASSCTIALSLDETCKLEMCLRGMIESQSFSLWALSAVFKFLRDSNCVPDDSSFGHLVGSMTTAISAQAKASFAATSFLQQKRRETYVSHLPVSTHRSVKHALFMTLLSTELFAEDVI